MQQYSTNEGLTKASKGSPNRGTGAAARGGLCPAAAMGRAGAAALTTAGLDRVERCDTLNPPCH
jgi:hypothetical protein